MPKIGTLFYDINGNDNLKKILEEDKKRALELKEVLGKVNLDSLNKSKSVVKQVVDEASKIGKINFSDNISKLVSRLKEARVEMDVYKQLMLETKNIGKKLEIKTNLKQVENEAEQLMRQISALESAQKTLNIKANTKSGYYSMGDESQLRQMRDFYSMEEKSANKREAANKREEASAKQKINQEERLALARTRTASQVEATQRRTASQEALNQQRLRTEIERTNAAHQRYINSTVSGHKKINSSIGLTNKTLFSQQNLMRQLSQAAGIYFSVYQVGSFIRSLYTVSGEFEKQKVSLGAILQNTEQAGVLYERIKDLAVKSPFQFSELISYTKQLSAFSIPYNELYDTTKRLADISAGLGVDMNRLVLALGQVRSASVLRGQELRQFTEAGIPLVDELAKKFTKLTGEATSTGDVFDKISRRQVSFQMVKDIFTELTSEGGKFYKFQEIQAESLAGKLSNLKDSYQIMLSQIGEGNSGVMKDSVELLTSMMSNWESIARILKTLVVTYGTYRAVLITINALQKANVALTGAQRVLDLVNLARASKGLTAATYSQVAAQRALNFVMSIIPYVAIASVIAGLVGAIVLFSEKTKTAADIQNEFNKKLVEEQQQIEQNNSTARGYIKTVLDLNSSYSKRKKAFDDLQKLMPEVFKNMKMEKFAALGLADAYNLVDRAVSKSSLSRAKSGYISATKEVLKAERKLAEAESKTTGVKGSREAFQRLELAREAQRLAKKQYQDLIENQKIQENIVKRPNSGGRIVSN
jgi:tape measure domain-containing protein